MAKALASTYGISRALIVAVGGGTSADPGLGWANNNIFVTEMAQKYPDWVCRERL
jgi:hypothetical protein